MEGRGGHRLQNGLPVQSSTRMSRDSKLDPCLVITGVKRAESSVKGRQIRAPHCAPSNSKLSALNPLAAIHQLELGPSRVWPSPHLSQIRGGFCDEAAGFSVFPFSGLIAASCQVLVPCKLLISLHLSPLCINLRFDATSPQEASPGRRAH